MREDEQAIDQRAIKEKLYAYVPTALAALQGFAQLPHGMVTYTQPSAGMITCELSETKISPDPITNDLIVNEPIAKIFFILGGSKATVMADLGGDAAIKEFSNDWDIINRRVAGFVRDITDECRHPSPEMKRPGGQSIILQQALALA